MYRQASPHAGQPQRVASRRKRYPERRRHITRRVLQARLGPADDFHGVGLDIIPRYIGLDFIPLLIGSLERQSAQLPKRSLPINCGTGLNIAAGSTSRSIGNINLI